MEPSNYLPTLDGWRALSIALVILHHSQLQCTIPILGAMIRALSNIGETGVELFFAISGLLICSRLLDEESHSGRINVKNFYIRRCFRILPAAIFYLLVIAILAAFHIIPLWPFDWFAALLFFRNYAMVFEYLHHSPLALHWYTGHFWSLSMEEHFYLLLPAVLVVFKKTRRYILISLVVVIALWRFLLTHILHGNYQINFRTDTHHPIGSQACPRWHPKKPKKPDPNPDKQARLTHSGEKSGLAGYHQRAAWKAFVVFRLCSGRCIMKL